MMGVSLIKLWALVEAKKVQPRLLEVLILEFIIRSQHYPKAAEGSGKHGPAMSDISRGGAIIQSPSLPWIPHFTR